MRKIQGGRGCGGGAPAFFFLKRLADPREIAHAPQVRDLQSTLLLKPNIYRTIARMEDDIQRAIDAAWLRIRPILDRDPDELRKRLARRQSALITNPPRAWCLAVRASDTRLGPYCHTYPDQSEPHCITIRFGGIGLLVVPALRRAMLGR